MNIQFFGKFVPNQAIDYGEWLKPTKFLLKYQIFQSETSVHFNYQPVILYHFQLL